MPRLREIIRDRADEIKNWLGDAVGDMAYDYKHGGFDENWEAKIKRAERDGVQDMQGWLADEYYNDVDSIRDICGDRIHDAATQIISLDYGSDLDHNKIFIEICEEIKEYGHTALKEAMTQLIDSKMKWMKEYGAKNA